jgi:hypothetical protein
VSDPASNGAGSPGFLDRARLRRRLRHLEQRKEIALRDIGGLTFELHRAGRSSKKLVDEKLAALDKVDAELLTLRTTLQSDSGSIDLHEPGLATCDNCGAVMGSDDKFCSECGTPTSS